MSCRRHAEVSGTCQPGRQKWESRWILAPEAAREGRFACTRVSDHQNTIHRRLIGGFLPLPQRRELPGTEIRWSQQIGVAQQVKSRIPLFLSCRRSSLGLAV
jgi:hypothetical protein